MKVQTDKYVLLKSIETKKIFTQKERFDVNIPVDLVCASVSCKDNK
jgi:K+-transporting ATPase c subunit